MMSDRDTKQTYGSASVSSAGTEDWEYDEKARKTVAALTDCLTSAAPLLPALERTEADFADLPFYWDEASACQEDFFSLVHQYCASCPASRDPAENLALAALCEAALLRPREEDGQRMLELFRCFQCAMETYLLAAYQPDMLTLQNCRLLPRRSRFACMVMEAEAAGEEGRPDLYAELLSRASREYPPMTPVVHLLLDEQDAALAQKNSLLERTEFDMYSSAIKDNLSYMLEIGNYDDAVRLLRSYQEMNPFDPDIPDIQRELGLERTKPVFC